MTASPARSGKLAPLIMGRGGWTRREPFTCPETRSSRILEAPDGVYIDVTGADFCKSKEFSSGTNAETTRWAVCAKPSGLAVRPYPQA
jgi:hypothetical protein